MHCRACDALLSDREITLKCKTTGEYLDLCSECYLHSQEALYEAFSENSVEIVEKHLTAYRRTSIILVYTKGNDLIHS